MSYVAPFSKQIEELSGLIALGMSDGREKEMVLIKLDEAVLWARQQEMNSTNTIRREALNSLPNI